MEFTWNIIHLYAFTTMVYFHFHFLYGYVEQCFRPDIGIVR